MNTRVFGTDDSPSMWYFPRVPPKVEGQPYDMGDICLPTTKEKSHVLHEHYYRCIN
jgi:hypothetical protein